MMGTWWFFWLTFMFIFLVPPLGYGWGYRGWGPPYPRYIQRRRGLRASIGGGKTAAYRHHAWGWGGDFVWTVLFVGVAWAFLGLWW